LALLWFVPVRLSFAVANGRLNSSEMIEKSKNGQHCNSYSSEDLVEHYFPKDIWFHPFESCAWPATPTSPGVVVYRVREHPADVSQLSITYAILYRDDCGGLLGIDSHPGDVEAFSYTLIRDNSCAIGWRLFSVKTTAHAGAPRDVGLKILNSCEPLPELFVSLKKHGTYLTMDQCNQNFDPTQRCGKGFAADFILVDAGAPDAPLADDLSAYFPSETLSVPVEYIWSGDGRFCGGQEVDDRSECVRAPGSKLVDDALLAPARQIAVALIALGDSLTHGTMDATNNYINTSNGYLQKISDSLEQELPLYFHQPFFDLQENRIDPSIIPTNLAVDGSDIFSLEGIAYYKRAGTPESYESKDLLSDRLFPARLKDKYDKVLYPLNLRARQPVSELDSAIWILNEELPRVGIEKALVIFWSGNNDSGSSALGSGGAKPTFQPLPFDLIKSELKPGLRLLLAFGERNGELSFEPYTQAAIERNLTDLDDFVNQYEHVLNRLLTETGADGVKKEIFLLTLPYYSAVGYLMDSEDLEFYLQKLNPDYLVPPTFKRVAPPNEPIIDPTRGDRITLLTFGMMYILLDSGYSIEEVNRVLEIDGYQRDGLVLSEEEQQYIMSRIDAYNSLIKEMGLSSGPNVHLVDIGQYLNDALVGETEIRVKGKILNRKWVHGGTFSLDGVHPGYTGQAVIANFVLKKLNGIFGLKAKPFNLSKIMAHDPYFDKDEDGWAPGLSYEASGITKLLFLFNDPDDSDPEVQVQLPPDIWNIISDVLLHEILNIPVIRSEAVRLGITPEVQTPQTE